MLCHVGRTWKLFYWNFLVFGITPLLFRIILFPLEEVPRFHLFNRRLVIIQKPTDARSVEASTIILNPDQRTPDYPVHNRKQLNYYSEHYPHGKAYHTTLSVGQGYTNAARHPRTGTREHSYQLCVV
jgi:hypothetical protein